MRAEKGVGEPFTSCLLLHLDRFTPEIPGFSASKIEIYLSLDVDNGAHKKTSISFDKSMSGYIMEYFNDYNLKDIRSLDIDLFLKYLRTERKQKNGIGMAPKTVKHDFVENRLHKILRRAMDRPTKFAQGDLLNLPF